MTTQITRKNHWGLALAAASSLVSLASIPLMPDEAVRRGGESGPPDPVVLFSAVMAVTTLVAAAVVWTRRRRAGLRVAAVAQLLDGVTALPAFFVPGVPAGLVLFAAVGVVLTLVEVWLLLARPRTAPAPARVRTSG